jgi:hypothetical protein
MQFVVEFGTFILVGFLSFSNGLAGIIEQYADSWAQQSVVTEIESTQPVPTLAQLSSDYNQKTSIPNILLKNARFQSAASIGGIQSFSQPVTNPADALVNIYCTYTTDTHVQATTGSGFFISKTGIILTNAHIAQFLLLEEADRPGVTDCVIRTGSPARPMYKAELLYVPPSWIQTNASLVGVETPTGTGERDYALLHAANGINNTPLPASFPYAAINTQSFTYDDVGMTVEVFGYPATPLMEEGISAEIVLVQATTTVNDLFTFAETTADLLAVSNETISHGGVSGGPVFDTNNTVIGVNVTKGSDESFSLRALTIDYINRTIQEETGLTLHQYIAGDAAVRAQTFKEALAPFLVTLLEFQLRKQD